MPSDLPTIDVQHGLLDLAAVRLEQLLAEPSEPRSTLDAVIHRLFDPREQLTVSAFASSL